MKGRNNKFIFIVFAIVAIFATIAFGCKNVEKPPQPSAFATPVATVSGDTLSWNNYDDATNGYTVKVGDETIIVYQNSLDLTTVTEKLVSGKNELAVKVNSTDYCDESEYSAAVEYVYTPPTVDPPRYSISIYGVGNVEILQGTFFNPLGGVSAVNENGDDLTALITVSGDINSSKAGEYTLTYSVADEWGNRAQASRKITVIANAEIGKEKPIPVYTVSGGNYNIAKDCATRSTSVNGNALASSATDGDMSSRWESAHKVDNVNLTVDLGATLEINEITIYWEAAYATSFDLLVSTDGTTWKKLASIDDQRLDKVSVFGVEACVNSFPDLTERARYVRIACRTRYEVNYGYSVREIEVIGPTGTVIPKEEYPDLFDAGSAGSPDWTITDSQWIEFDLGAVTSVDTMRLAFKSYLTPASYRVLYAGADKEFEEISIKNLPYSGDTFSFAPLNGNNALTLTARYFRVEMDARRFYSPAYRITEVEFRLGSTRITASSARASTEKSGHAAALMLDGNDGTYWENDNSNVYQTIDLSEVKAVGRVDVTWRGDDGGKGKYYDLQVSTDGVQWTTVFRQTHGATAKQSVYVYADARYLRIVDYQSPNAERYMTEGIVIHSQYPQSSGEGKINYDTTLVFPERKVIEDGNGSYITGGTDFPSSRLIAYLDESLRGSPVPSNDWWQGLLIRDKGYNMYMNPLTATFMSDGLWLTNPGEGYFDGFVPGNGSQTVDVDAHDIAIGYAGMGADAEVRVTGYSDYGISAVMTDNRGVDKLTVFLSEGALYAYCIFAEPQNALIRADNFVRIFDSNGNRILESTGAQYTGDCIVVMVRTHSGYVSGIRKYKDGSGAEKQNDPLYEERYYVVSVPNGTQFKRGEDDISVVMTEGNYMSVGAVAQKNEVREGEISGASFPSTEVGILHDHGYAFVTGTSCTYTFDGDTNTVTTDFRLNTMLMRSGYSPVAYSAYLPHQLAKSDYDGGQVYKSIRGDCRSHIGNSFVTTDRFYGVVPTFVEPTDDGYSAKVLYDQLVMLYNNNGGDKAPEDSNLISGDPYWQGKNLHPMAMAAIAADQIGATDLRDAFLDKIEYILTDWFTYDEAKDESTGAYFYYDGEWGTLYYKNSEFGAGVNLADHYFTYGYYTLASGVLAAYRPEFAAEWGNMIELLIRDYMNPSRDDELFPYMRNFDPFAGHGWAGGYADNNGGNNQESAGEALNSWVGAYLYATAVGNEDIRTAAIYGYTTELAAIKHYWFDYFGDFPDSYQYGVVGQVYGGSNFYGTFFNGQPLFMYGIHLIPGEEYLTSYALNGGEREKLEVLIDKMRAEQAMWDVAENEKTIYAWQHIFIPIVAIYDADEAIEWYEEVLRTQGNVGNTSEQFNVYWLIHGMKSTGVRTTDIYAEDGASATVYEKDGQYTALCWNPTGEAKRITFRNESGVTGYAVVPAGALVSCDPTRNTESFTSYADVSNFDINRPHRKQNATASGGNITFASNGSVDYLLSFGSADRYYQVSIAGANDGVSLKIDGRTVELTRTAGGYISEPTPLSFKHTITVSGSNVAVSAMSFDVISLSKANVSMTANASSELGTNTANKAADGDITSRWESVHASDDEWIEFTLAEPTAVYRLMIHWEGASAGEYNVYFSATGKNDEVCVYRGESSVGYVARTDTITPEVLMQVKYIRIECVSRTTTYGYSIFELEVYNFDNNNQGA